MAATQAILFTVIPRGVAVDADTLPVSVHVAPRLRGATTLGAFDDWLRWTRHLAEDGLTLTLRSGAAQVDVAVDPAPLVPELWEALFDASTLVRSHEFSDFSDRAVMSYGMRDALSVVKSIYQEASVALALPAGDGGEHGEGNRWKLRRLVSDLAVHWSDEEGRRWRAVVRDTPGEPVARDAGELDDEGLLRDPPQSAARSALAHEFSVYHHMPTPDGELEEPDWQTKLDFHQALGSLDDYPTLQRALGVVFEIELPGDFVPVGSVAPQPTLSVSGVRPGWDWALEPRTPELATACVHVDFDGGRRLFFTAPRLLAGGPAALDPPVLGLLDLDARLFGLAQVDVDGAMHKAIMLADTWSTAGPQRNLDPGALPQSAPHPEVFDPEATLPALRSGGFSLFADRRAQQLLHAIKENGKFNEAIERGLPAPPPFYAEDLVRGYRLDVWDSHTGDWHSLHARRATYAVVDGPSLPAVVEEGFVQLAVTQPAPGAAPEENDLYLHEAIARWAGWSLAVEMPGLHLSRYADPDDAIPDPNDEKFDVNGPVTPFKLAPTFEIVKGTLPSLRFGRRYRFRARAVDLAGAGLGLDDAIADELSEAFALPHDSDGMAYLRYEPVPAPTVVIREQSAVTEPGSAVDRLVIRTFNATPAQDDDAAVLDGSERHVLPPRASVEMAERLGMFDTPAGALAADAATWALIGARDAGELTHATFAVAGSSQDFPIEAGDTVAPLPYLPDALAAGAALRDLPGTPSGSSARIASASAAGTIAFSALDDPNPRRGSATLVSFEGEDWQQAAGFRLVPVGAPAGGGAGPSWDPVGRALTLPLPKGSTATIPLSSYVAPAGLTLLGVWKWLREYVDARAVNEPWPVTLQPGADVERIAHVLQRAVEGGHWMLTPPRLLTLVHAVQQPLGALELIPLRVEQGPSRLILFLGSPLQTKPSAGREDPTELATITAYRHLNAVDAYLVGGLRLHGASTARVDLHAEWEDPVDDPGDPANDPTTDLAHHHAHVDELLLPRLGEGYVLAGGPEPRRVGWYDPEHDQIAFVRAGAVLGRPGAEPLSLDEAAPRHLIGDTRHHRVRYTAVAASRYREYFDQEAGLDFTRSSAPVVVDVPASARPLAPDPVYVVPTFGWQRQSDTNIKRSVRFGGGLRVYLRRPWFSSGAGELLGVALWSQERPPPTDGERDHYKAYMTQWGMDPIWQTGDLGGVPSIGSFTDAVAHDTGVTLEEATARDASGAPGIVDVVGFAPRYDATRGLWFADLTVDTGSWTYMPFVRLALVRHQPNALPDAKISRVVLADFAQLTPDRSALVTGDPHRPRRLSVVVSGVAPRGPGPRRGVPPTRITVRVQQRDPALPGDLAWEDAPAATATATATHDGLAAAAADLALWSGFVQFADPPEPGRFRILVEEHELFPGGARRDPPARLVYAEAFAVDTALVSG